MPIRMLMRAGFFLLAAMLLSACGGGGGGGGGTPTNAPDSGNWDTMVWDQGKWS